MEKKKALMLIGGSLAAVAALVVTIVAIVSNSTRKGEVRQGDTFEHATLTFDLDAYRTKFESLRNFGLTCDEFCGEKYIYSLSSGNPNVDFKLYNNGGEFVFRAFFKSSCSQISQCTYFSEPTYSMEGKKTLEFSGYAVFQNKCSAEINPPNIEFKSLKLTFDYINPDFAGFVTYKK